MGKLITSVKLTVEFTTGTTASPDNAAIAGAEKVLLGELDKAGIAYQNGENGIFQASVIKREVEPE